jgi:hypothetical protein
MGGLENVRLQLSRYGTFLEPATRLSGVDDERLCGYEDDDLVFRACYAA